MPAEIRVYTGFHDELSESSGFLFKAEQLIVPKTLHKDMLQRIHEGHLGWDKCLARAREVFFWTGMSAHIISTVTRCSVCNQFQKAQWNWKEPLIHHETPSLPWEKIGADLFQFDGKQFLLLVDY